MSVLIEALSLVVPRKVLDKSYPGGTDAYLRDAAANRVKCRYAVADEQLTVMSFLDPAAATPVVERLQELGIVHVDGDMAVELVFVDQHHGPTIPCPWLAWEARKDGVTCAWAQGNQPGDMATPDGWTAESSKRLQRTDIREEPGRAMRIASENGLETWVDFQTGAVIHGLPHRKETPASPAPPPPAESCASPDASSFDAEAKITKTVLSAVESRGWTRVIFGRDGTTIDLLVACPRATFRLYAIADEGQEVLGVFVVMPGLVPEDRRDAVAAFITRANFGRKMGNFELDYSDGEVRFRTSVDVEGGMLGETMVQNMFSNALRCANEYYDGLQRVVYANLEPAAAIAEIEKAR